MSKSNKPLRIGIGVILGLLLIFGAKTMADRLAEKKPKPRQKAGKTINKIYAQTIKNEELPVVLQENGRLQALRKVDLYAEVQGILKESPRLFKPGQAYDAGAVLMSIDDREFVASLSSQKSVLYNQIAQILPDLKLDYTESFAKWQSYLASFDISRSVPALPAFDSDREKYFVNNSGIITSYYNIKNLEERHKKYEIKAPFYGVVTEAMVNPGTLVRPGQQLGSFLSPTTYELPLAVDESFTKYISPGKQVDLYTLDRSSRWTGKIARINPTIDPATQGTVAFIQVRGKDLKEGMFLQAEIAGSSIASGVEVPRKLLVNDNQLYVIEEDQLQLRRVDIALYKANSAIITNLNDGTQILANPMPSAYEGMPVEIIESKG